MANDQKKQAEKNPDSNGLGLSICYQIAKKLGGNLTYVDQRCGSRFYLSLNLKEEQKPVEQPPEEQTFGE